MIVSSKEIFHTKLKGCLFAFALVVIALSVSCEARIIELNHRGLDSNSFFWPNPKNVPFELTILDRGLTEGGFWYENNKFTSSEHIGTHLDAPSHFAKGKWRLDQIPPERFIAPGAVIDIRKKVKTNMIYQLTEADVDEWIEENGMFQNNSVILVNTGWSKRYGNKAAYFGHETDMKKFAFPGVGIKATEKILDLQNTHEINIVGVGVDTPSIDYGKSTTYPTHVALSTANVYILENLNNLEEMPATGTEVIALPLKIIGGSGSPCRVLARINEDQQCMNGSTGFASNSLLLLLAPLMLALSLYTKHI